MAKQPDQTCLPMRAALPAVVGSHATSLACLEHEHVEVCSNVGHRG